MYGRDFTQGRISSSDNRREYVSWTYKIRQFGNGWFHCLWLDIDGDGLAQILAGSVQVVAEAAASACACPGGSCMSISVLPVPKWTHEGVPFTIVVPGGRQSCSTPT